MQTNQFWIGALLLSVVMISRCTCQVIRIDTEKKKGEAKEYPVTGPGWQSDSGEIQQENPQDRPLEAAPEVSPEPKPIQWSTLPGCNTKTSCKLDSDCSNGLLCHQGSCKAGSKCPAGASCQCKSDKFCGGGQACQRGVCNTIPCKSDCDCGVGSFCNSSNICAGCAPKCVNSTSCSPNDFCQRFGQGCTRCKKMKTNQFGEPCRADSQCKSNLCILTMASAIGFCSALCKKDSECPSNARCKTLSKEYCQDTSSDCGFCTPAQNDVGCVSLRACRQDKDCQTLTTQCSCCNQWRCNTTNRCHMVFR